MRGNRSVVVVAVTTLLASTVIALLQGGASVGLTQLQYSVAAPYSPLPQQVLTNADINFAPLSDSQLLKVRVSASQAVIDAERQSASTKKSAVVQNTLGGVTNRNAIVDDWEGSKSWVPASVPSYVVKIDGAYVTSLGPNGGFVHKMIAVVNAENGHVVETILYN